MSREVLSLVFMLLVKLLVEFTAQYVSDPVVRLTA